MGPYPSSETDVKLLKVTGITACLDLLAPRDIDNLKINHSKLQHLLRKSGNIDIYRHCPVDDLGGDCSQQE